MRWVDIAIVLIVVGSGIAGLARGLIVEVAAVLGVVAGLLVAREAYGPARDFLGVFFHKDARLAAVAYLLAAIIVWMLIVTLARLVRGLLRFSPLVMIDRLGGAALGLVLGIVAVSLFLQLAARVHDPSLHTSIRASRLAPIFRYAVPGLSRVVPRALVRATSAGIPVDRSFLVT